MSLLAVEYVRAGFALVEIRPGSKAPMGRDWQKIGSAIRTEEQAALLPEGTGLGLAHRWCKTCAVDVDDIKMAATWFALRDIALDDLLAAPDAVLNTSGREGRAKLIYRLPDNIECLKTVKPSGSGLELRNATSDGLTVQDVVSPSIHPDTGKPYEWIGDWRKLPVLPPALLAVWQGLVTPKAKAKLNGTNGTLPPTRSLDELKDALDYISPDEYETWIKVGMALHDNFHGDGVGLDCWDQWSTASDKYEQGECAQRWASFTPKHGVTAAAIFGMAKQAGAPVGDMARARNLKPPKRVKADLSIVDANGTQKKPVVVPISWRSLGLPETANGAPIMDMNCALKVLRGVDRWANRVHYDTFMLKILIDDEPLIEQHDLEFLEYLQSDLGLGKFPPLAAQMALRSYAFANQRDCVKEWLLALPPWDGIPRNASIFPDLFGAVRNEYSEQAGINFMRSMAARILNPGCMVKQMVILEGEQDIGKSKALRLIAGKQWFTEQHERAESKDFYMVFEGKFLIEVSELDSFSKSEVSRIKQVVSCECDRYRSPYGRAAEDHPRRSVLVGTTNKDDYLHDDTGGVRFWPIRCTTIAFDAIVEQREQLFAEAREDVLRGEPWWIMPMEETKREQDERYSEDPWRDRIAEICTGENEINIPEILQHRSMDFQIKDIGKMEKNRVAACLRHLGWKNTVAWRGGKPTRVWKRK